MRGYEWCVYVGVCVWLWLWACREDMQFKRRGFGRERSMARAFFFFFLFLIDEIMISLAGVPVYIHIYPFALLFYSFSYFQIHGYHIFLNVFELALRLSLKFRLCGAGASSSSSCCCFFFLSGTNVTCRSPRTSPRSALLTRVDFCCLEPNAESFSGRPSVCVDEIRITTSSLGLEMGSSSSLDPSSESLPWK